MRTLHVAFRCRGAWRKIFLDGLGIEVSGASEEAGIDGVEEGCDGGLHRLWCMNFTAFALVVRWYKNDASAGIGLNGGCGA